MYDIIFDFSSSSGGGGRKRAEAYARLLQSKRLSTLFLLNSKLKGFPLYSGNVRVEFVRQGTLERLFNDGERLERYVGMAKWYFAYGIPIYRRIGAKNWFHVSNVLPFARGRYSAGPALKAKMALLGHRVRRTMANIDQFSAESQFGETTFRSYVGKTTHGVFLQNGMVEPSDQVLSKLSSGAAHYATTVGTYSYKRLDRVVEVFMHMRRTMPLEVLKIVGETKGIPKSVLTSPHVELLGAVEPPEVLRLLSNASLFISASEIENSSNAVLEALALDTKAVLSCIPSHLEMIDCSKPDFLVVSGKEYVIAERRNVMPKYKATWPAIVDTMLSCNGIRV